MEQWKDIKGYEGLYQVSNLGRVKTIKTNKIRKLEKVRSGYLRVMLCKNNKSERFLVHRLVAEAFISNPNSLPEVNHKDENKLNNNVENLEWCTAKYNNSYGKGALARNQRVIQYDLQGNAIKIWESIKEASEELGVSQEGISACCRGIHKTSGGYAWTYANIQNIRMRWKKTNL